jgi:hypothetical protein
MTSGRIYVATQSGTTEVNGQTYVFTRGVTRVREGHPLLGAVGNHYFEPVTEHVHYEWETNEAPPVRRAGK